MPTTDETAVAALRSMLAEAGARPCSACREPAAVRTQANGAPARHQAGFDAAAKFVWLCFECGHEEPELA